MPPVAVQLKARIRIVEALLIASRDRAALVELCAAAEDETAAEEAVLDRFALASPRGTGALTQIGSDAPDLVLPMTITSAQRFVVQARATEAGFRWELPGVLGPVFERSGTGLAHGVGGLVQVTLRDPSGEA